MKVRNWYELAQAKTDKYAIELDFYNGEPNCAWIVRRNTNDDRIHYLPPQTFNNRRVYNAILKEYGFKVTLISPLPPMEKS